MRIIGQTILNIFLIVIFYGCFTPIGIILRLFWDPMDRRIPDERSSFWLHKNNIAFDPKSYYKQR